MIHVKKDRLSTEWYMASQITEGRYTSTVFPTKRRKKSIILFSNFHVLQYLELVVVTLTDLVKAEPVPGRPRAVANYLVYFLT